MKVAGDIITAIVAPVRNPTLLTAFLAFYLASELIIKLSSGGHHALVLGLVLAAFVLPAMCVYLMDVLERQACGALPKPPSVEHLQWFNSAWSLLQLLYLSAFAYTAYALGSLFGEVVFLGVLLVFAAVLPASLAILALTHSPVESLNPKAITRLIKRCRVTYWVAPAFALAAIFLVGRLSRAGTPDWLTELVALFLFFALYTLIGAIVRPQRLHEEIAIHQPVEPDANRLDAALLKERAAVLGHAYGLASRGNRHGGLRHVQDRIACDPAPDTAWRWFFEQMLDWDDKDAALGLGQHYLGWLLERGDDVSAVKLMTRCRLENETFQPLREDRELALQAAGRCGNEELVRALEQPRSGLGAGLP